MQIKFYQVFQRARETQNKEPYHKEDTKKSKEQAKSIKTDQVHSIRTKKEKKERKKDNH